MVKILLDRGRSSQISTVFQKFSHLISTVFHLFLVGFSLFFISSILTDLSNIHWSSNSPDPINHSGWLWVEILTTQFGQVDSELGTNPTRTNSWTGLSISTCGVWGVRAEIQVYKKELHTYIHLSQSRISTFYISAFRKN